MWWECAENLLIGVSAQCPIPTRFVVENKITSTSPSRQATGNQAFIDTPPTAPSDATCAKSPVLPGFQDSRVLPLSGHAYQEALSLLPAGIT